METTVEATPRPPRPPASVPYLTLERPELIFGRDAPLSGPLAWLIDGRVYPRIVGVGIPAHGPEMPLGAERPVAGASPYLTYQLTIQRFGGIRVGTDFDATGKPLGQHVSAWVLPDVHHDLFACKVPCPFGWDYLRHTNRSQLALQRLTWMLHGLGATIYRMMPGAWGGSCPAIDAWAADFEYRDGLAVGIRSRHVDFTNPDTF